MTTQTKTEYPFMVKAVVTFTVTNPAGIEEKKKETLVFNIDKPSASKPWYVLRNFLVPTYLINKYGPQETGWNRIYEIKIIKQLNKKDPNDITDIPLRIMTREQLSLYCEKWELSVPVEEFYSVEKAREMVALRQEDEKGYEKHLAEYREGKQRNYPELDSVRGKDSVSLANESEFERIEKLEKDVVTKKHKPKKPMGEVVTDPEPTQSPDTTTHENPFGGM